MYISIICFPGCDVLIKPFSYMTKKLRKKFKYLENEKNFEDETKSIFALFLKRFQMPKLFSNLTVRP